MSIKGLRKDEYDVVIIGAGIGGLVCGCYLAKAGMKVLIIEQHHKPGGYCQTFSRNGFKFDACVHSLGSFRKEGGQLFKICSDLQIDKHLTVKRADPSDGVLVDDYAIVLGSDIEKNIDNIQKYFPAQEISIRRFLDFITKTNFLSMYAQLKNKTFDDLLRSYFSNDNLRLILSIFLGNLGLPASKLSALTGAILYKEFILDGGYYLVGGMQVFPDTLVAKFKEHGGKIMFSCMAKKILVSDSRVRGIMTDKQDVISAKYVVSTCDAKQTFLNLIDAEYLVSSFANKINKMCASLSAFIVYIGLNKEFDYGLPFKCRTLWYSPKFINVNKVYDSNLKGEIDIKDGHILCNFSSLYDHTLAPKGKGSIFLLLVAPFKTEGYWTSQRDILKTNLIERLRNAIPNVTQHIEFVDTATPLTFYRYTLNTEGAGYGWASTTEQVDQSLVPQISPLKGLFLAGHWATMGGGQGGVSTVAYSGFNAARLIMRENTSSGTIWEVFK